MKTITIGIIVALAIASIAASPSPETGIVPGSEKKLAKQTYASFSFFRIHRQGRGVTSTWGLNSETGISGYVVQRTYLDPGDPYGWENVYATPCSGSRSYKWTDENVFAGFISYRIIAVPTGGIGEVMSGVETIHIMGH